MTRAVRIALICLALAACREDAATAPAPVPLPPDARGHYSGMALAEVPGPKGQIHLDGQGAPIFFGQVRDAIAYLRLPEQSDVITAAYVSDMGAAPGTWVAADAAHFVVGADPRDGDGVPGLMPFADPSAARAFVANHGGKVLRLSDIGDDEVLTPVNALPGGPGGPGDPGGLGETEDYRERLRALGSDRQG